MSLFPQVKYLLYSINWNQVSWKSVETERLICLSQISFVISIVKNYLLQVTVKRIKSKHISRICFSFSFGLKLFT